MRSAHATGVALAVGEAVGDGEGVGFVDVEPQLEQAMIPMRRIGISRCTRSDEFSMPWPST
jgi:hypothetical protein